MDYKDYYNILGIDRDADKAQIKRAYQKLARKFHPDISKENDAEARFKEVNEAYHVLKDPETRQAYDQLGSGWHQGQEFRPPPGWRFQFSEGFDPQEMAQGGFSDFFSSIFGNAAASGDFQRSHRPLRMRGSDLHNRIRLTLEEAFHGTQRTLSLQTQDQTPEGRLVPKTRQLNVHIPNGICEGQQIRLAAQGGAGVGGGPNGDLFLEVIFESHRYFHAEGRNIFMDLPITPWEAALGARLKVPTLGGGVMVTIPAGSQSGRKLRLEGRGLPGTTPGDQYVVLLIETPPADSEEARRVYQQMSETMPFDPRQPRGL